MTTIAPPAIIEALRSRMENSEQPVLGSSLGTLLFTQWQGMDKSKFRDTFGSLKNFLVLQFGDDIQEVGRQGGDILFGWKGKSYEALQPTRVHSYEEREFWRLFTNPTESGRLIEIGGHLQASSDVSLLTSRNWKEIKRMSVSEQIELATTFVENHVTKSESVMFENVFEPPSQYWGKFVAIMRDNSHLYQRWKVYRVERIEELFRTKCIEAKVDQNFIDDLWRELKDGVRVKANEIARSMSTNAHEIAANAVLLLTEEELSSLRLPTRVWLELLKKHG